MQSQRRLRAAGVGHAAGDDGVDDGADLVVGQPAVAVGGDGRDDREDPAGEVGAAGRRVVVGRVVERLDARSDGVASADRSSRQSFFSAPRANSEPEPTEWNVCSS